MENNNWGFNPVQQTSVNTQEVSRTFMASVFSWMGIALAISAVTAYVFGLDESYRQYLYDSITGKPTGLAYFAIFSPIGFVLLMSFGFQRLSATVLSGLFLLFSVLMGLSLSSIFMRYQADSIGVIFGVSALMFGVMALVGYTTKTDLTKLGSILMMALVGIIIASLINLFLQSGPLAYVMSFVSVIVFTGLTAYDVQKLKEIGANTEAGAETTTKVAILGAMNLYLDFINLFLALLRLFGNRK